MPRSSGTSSAAWPSAEPREAPAAAPGYVPLAFRSVKVRPTASGAVAVALLLASGIVAVNAGNNLLYLVVASLLSLFSLSGVLAYANLKGLAVRAVPADEVYAGQPASVAIEIFNRRRRLPAYLLTVSGGGSDETAVEISAGRCAALHAALTFAERGRRPYPERLLTSEFPFGLVRRGGTFRPPGACLVYPRPLPVAWEVVERAEREGELESRRSPGVGGDFRGQRDYTPGDSLSRIQWSSWLRLRRLQTKEFETEGAAPVTFSWDGVPGPGVEERLGQLTWLVRTALRRGRSVGLALPGFSVPPGTGAAHRRTLLESLALFGEQR